MDHGETVETAVARELDEETKMTLTAGRFLFCKDSLPLEAGKMHCVNLYFECKMHGEVQLNDEADRSAWVGEDELSGYVVVFRNDEGVRRYWQEVRR